MRFLAFLAQLRRGATPWLLGMSVLAYVVLAMQPAQSLSVLCGRVSAADLPELLALSQMLWTPRALAVDWALMSIAMMSPLISPQIAFVRRSIANRTKGVASLAVLLGFLFCWGLAGLIIVPLSIAVAFLFPPGWGMASVALLALIWGASPVAQRARNACHVFGRMRAFGADALADAVKLGCRTGFWCVVSCWPFMIVPALVQAGHVLSMVLVGLYLLADRMAPAAAVGWRLPPAFETALGHGLLTGRRSALSKL